MGRGPTDRGRNPGGLKIWQRIRPAGEGTANSDTSMSG